MRAKGEFADDNQMYDMAEKEYAQMEEQLKMYQLDNEMIMEALDREPGIAKMIQDIGAGAPARVAIARVFDIEDLTPQEGDEDFEQWEQSRSAYQETKSKRKQWEQSINEAQEFTKAEAAAFAEENGMSKADAAEFFGQVGEFLQDIYAGRISRKAIGMLKKAMDADKLVEEARAQGEIAGKNAKIKTEMVSKGEGDQTPIIASNDERAPEPPAPDLKKPGKRWSERINQTAKEKI